MTGLQTGLTLAAMWLPPSAVLLGSGLAKWRHDCQRRAARRRVRPLRYIPQQRKALR